MVDRVADQREQLLVIQHDVMLVQGIGARGSALGARHENVRIPRFRSIRGPRSVEYPVGTSLGPGADRRAAAAAFFQPTPPRCSLLIV